MHKINKILQCLVILIIISCNHSAKKANFNLSEFPKEWEKFGIENNDTVSYEPCRANNPQFLISRDFKKIQIIIGNELEETFKILSVTENAKSLTIVLDKNKSGIENCTFEWLDQKHFIGKWYINDETGNFYEYLPKNILDRYERIVEKCDEE